MSIRVSISLHEWRQN